MADIVHKLSAEGTGGEKASKCHFGARCLTGTEVLTAYLKSS